MRNRRGYLRLTRFQRANLALGLCLLACIAALSVRAQNMTVREAAAINVSGLTYLCTEIMFRRALPAQAFTASGFTYRAVDRGVNNYGVALGLDHYFDAPANTAKAEVDDPNRPAGICQVFTTHLSEIEVRSIVEARLFQTHPGAQRSGDNGWSLREGNSLPLIVSVSTIGNNHRYEPPGTVRVSMSFPG